MKVCLRQSYSLDTCGTAVQLCISCPRERNQPQVRMLSVSAVPPARRTAGSCVPGIVVLHIPGILSDRKSALSRALLFCVALAAGVLEAYRNHTTRMHDAT